MQGRVLKAFAFSGVEFLFLLGLWVLFVSQLRWAEFVAGVCAAALGAVGDGLIKAEGFAKFRPQAEWLSLFLWEPWYVLTGSAAIIRALARRLAGKRSEAQFKVVPFGAGGDNSKSAARRALTITEISISPDSIVVGIDRERKFMLLHLIAPTATPKLARRLGARS